MTASTSPLLPNQRRALDRVRRATVAREKAEQAWRAAIREAVTVDNCTFRAVADRAGVIHTRVYQLVSGRDRDR